MTDEELMEVSQLMLKDSHGAGLKAYTRLTAAERERMMLLVREKANEGVRRVIADAEADGSMDKIRELYAQDQAKKQNRKSR